MSEQTAGWRLRSSLLVWVLLAQSCLGALPCAEAAQVPEAETVSHRLWDKLLTHCGSSYFYAGSVFDSSGMLSNVQVAHQKTLEFRGVRFHTVPIRVTDAERANGLAYRARITMIAHLYREGDGSWQDGPDLRPRNTDDIIAQAIGDVNSDMFDMGGNGAIALELVKFKGTWAVTRSSTTSSSALGFGSKFFDVEKVIAAKTARYSCERSGVVQPTFTPAEIHDATIQRAMKAGRTREQAEALYKASEESQRKIDRDNIHLRDPQRGIPFLALTDEQMDRLKQLDDLSDLSNTNYAESGKASADRYKLWIDLQGQFPETPAAGQWLAPGTTYKVECHMHRDMCNYFHQQTDTSLKTYIAVQITSGPHAGQYAIIDERNLHITKYVGSNGLGGYGAVN